MKKIVLAMMMAGAALGALSLPAAAQGRLHGHVRYYDPANDPYYYGATPPVGYVGFVFQRHNNRCDYPHGFNVTDFTRNVNGIPRGGDELVETGCASVDPWGW